MDKNINLVEILKDCPAGTKLYSSIFGEVTFMKICKDNTFSIMVITSRDAIIHFSAKGQYYQSYDDSECLLFPSKDQRDWRKFIAPWYKKERFNPDTLKPFDKVLMRDSCYYCWRCAFFSHKREDERTPYKYAATYSAYKFCIPYNDDTKHLVGTTEEAPDYYCYWNN